MTRLVQAGVDVECHLYPSTFHSFEVMVPQVEVSQHSSESYVDAIARRLILKQDNKSRPNEQIYSLRLSFFAPIRAEQPTLRTG